MAIELDSAMLAASAPRQSSVHIGSIAAHTLAFSSVQFLQDAGIAQKTAGLLSEHEPAQLLLPGDRGFGNSGQTP